jgi:hypothetical protein
MKNPLRGWYSDLFGNRGADVAHGDECRFDIVRTSEGFMPYDHDCDEYLYDEKGNNCFDTYEEALRLVEDAIITIQEHHQERIEK